MTGKQPPEIVKANGEREPFVSMKLQNSLLRSGAAPELAEEVLKHIEDELEDGMTTKEIYEHAFQLLKQKKKDAAGRYSLRNAVMELGPTGFPFETFVAQIFKEKGYVTETDVMIQGKCVEHEIDVLAYDGEKLILMEAKFHNQHGITSDTQTALYVKARFDDLAGQPIRIAGSRPVDEGWLVTNTKFTSSALQYGTCAGIVMIGWNYPAAGNLQELIEESGLHPITCLTTLPENAKKILLENNTVLCKSVHNDEEALKAAGLSSGDIRSIREEAEQLCDSSST